MKINYLLHNQIDKQRWDRCISQSVNRLPYALSWWLDTVSPVWEALVEDDYLAVMPLTQKKKFGITYLFQPYFTQQLGIFSTHEISPTVIDQFFSTLPTKFRYIDIQLNTGIYRSNKDFIITLRKNFILDLSLSHERIAKSYHRNCRRNIQKAVLAGFTIEPGLDPSLFSRFINKHLDEKLSGIRKSFYPSLQQIITKSLQNGTGEILSVYNQNKELMATSWFVTELNRCIFAVCASTPKGKENQAMFLLVDYMIRKNAGTGLVFDFAGSNHPGIAYFNAGFGATETSYPAIKQNLLPWPMNLIKK